ncbi:MAG: YDG domain-containing protein [Verrucomicrobiia bacterium]
MKLSWMRFFECALLATVSTAMTVSGAPSAAYKLAFAAQPVTTTVGAKMTGVVVQLKAQNGTNVPQSGATILLALNKGAGLMGTTSMNTDVSGKATFTNLDIIQAGVGNALLASASGLKGATSSVFTVSQGKTTVTLTSSINPLVYGQSVTFTAKVSPVAPATGMPSGTVTFKDGSTILGSGTLNGSGQASFSTNKISAATTVHSIAAVYGGNTNFTGSTSGALSQTINKATLTVWGITASNKVYDAKTTATLKTNGAALVGVLAGDTVALGVSGAKGTFADKNIGTGKTVTVSGLTITGTSAGNYNLTQPASTASITRRSLTVTAKGVNKAYDGTTNATVTFTDNRVSGDVLTVSYATASFTNKTVGNGKLVNVKGLTISGIDSGNYLLAATTASTTANITAATLTVSGLTAGNKVYDAKTTATLNVSGATLVGVIAGDTMTLSPSGAKGVFANKNVGPGKTVTVSGLTIAGASAANYKLTQPIATASITARSLTVTAVGVNKIYDGTTAATVTLSDNRLAGDVLSESYAAASFADKIAANGKTVSVSGITLSGTDAGNYAPASTTATATANIAKATLTVTADSLSRPFGAANPALTASYSGLVGGETLATSGVTGNPGLTTTAIAGSPVAGGPYPITTALGSLSAVNYSFVFVNGTLTVTKAGTAVGVVSGLNPALTNQNITLTATVNPVSPSTAAPTGTVQFKNNGTNLGSPVSLAGGQASATVSGSALGAGSFTITAEYADAAGNFNNSTNGLTEVVNHPAPAAVACKICITPPQAGCVTASLTGTPGQTYVLQASTDMIHWTAISTNVADVNGLLSLLDTNAGKYSSRFYRGATLP